MKTLIDLNSYWSFEDDELDLLNSLVTTLEPVKLAVEAICRRDATLLTADATLAFMLNNLGSSEIASKLKESLARRVNERRINASSLLQYLHKGNQDYANLNLDPLLKFRNLNKTSIISMVIGLSNKENGIDDIAISDESESDNDIIESGRLTMAEKLNNVIETETNAKIISKKRSKQDITNVIKKELAIFDVEGSRGAHLEKCYANLCSIPPVSVESERVFSGCGLTSTKIRSSLNDESLDFLCFLRSHFKKTESK